MGPVLSSISSAYDPLAVEESGVQLYEVPLKPLAMVETVFKSLEAPFFNRRVTAPVAFAQVMSNGVPALTLTNCEAVMVNCAA